MYKEQYFHVQKSLKTQSIIKVFLDDTAVIKYSIITLIWIRCRILYKISCHPFLKIFVNLILNVCSFINTCINVSSLVTEPLYLEEDIIKMFWHRKGEIVSSPGPWGICRTCRIYWQTQTLVQSPDIPGHPAAIYFKTFTLPIQTATCYVTDF